MKKSTKIFLGILYWVWQLTWGLPMTLIGLIAAGLAFSAGGRAYKNGFSFVVEVGGNWGGISLGAVTLTGKYKDGSKSWYEHIRRHEFGHSVQNLIFGPLFPFVVGFPSLLRAWYFNLTPNKPHQEYDYAWFEYTASKWGHDWINKIDGQNIAYTYLRLKKNLKK